MLMFSRHWLVVTMFNTVKMEKTLEDNKHLQTKSVFAIHRAMDTFYPITLLVWNLLSIFSP